MAAQGRVRIYRLDGGGPKEKGSYRCDECSWEAHGVARTAANHHTERRHEGRGAQLSRCVPQSSGGRRLSQDPAAVRNRERMRRERGEGKAAAARVGRLAEAGIRWPVAVTTTGEFDTMRSFVLPGRGERTVPGGYDAMAKEGFEVALSLVSIHAPRLGAWLGVLPGPAALVDRYTDVRIAGPCADTARSQASASACAALSLCLVLGGAQLPEEGEVVVTGYLDLRGFVMPVSDVRRKVEHCMRRGVHRVLAPQQNLQEIEEEGGWGSVELRQYAARSVRGVGNLVDLLAEAMGPRFQAPSDARRILEADRVVAFASGQGLLGRDQVYDFEVQCCWTRPGNCGLRMTGCLSDVSKEAVRLMRAMVVAQTPAILERLQIAPGPAAKARPSLVRRDADLHVHLEHGWQPVSPAYQCGAIYVALVSLLIGRRPGDRVLVFGDVTTTGDFSGRQWQLDKEWVKWAVKSGYRTVVLGEGARLTPVAASYAASKLRDQEPRLLVVSTGTALGLLGIVFGGEASTAAGH